MTPQHWAQEASPRSCMDRLRRLRAHERATPPRRVVLLPRRREMPDSKHWTSDPEHLDHVAPLLLGDLTALAVPEQLAQDRVLGALDPQLCAARAYLHATPARELDLVVGTSAETPKISTLVTTGGVEDVRGSAPREARRTASLDRSRSRSRASRRTRARGTSASRRRSRCRWSRGARPGGSSRRYPRRSTRCRRRRSPPPRVAPRRSRSSPSGATPCPHTASSGTAPNSRTATARP